MKFTHVAVILSCIAMLAGCAARNTKDPAQKLSWAAEEFEWKKDPIAAEELLRVYLQIYSKQMNSLHLAETYRQYGLFLRSHAVTKYKDHYLRFGFLDESIQYNTRYEKALEYFNKSREIISDKNLAEPLSRVYVNIAETYANMDMVPESCENLDKGRKSYAAVKAASVEARQVGINNYNANYEAYIALMQAQLGCPMKMTAGVVLNTRGQ